MAKNHKKSILLKLVNHLNKNHGVYNLILATIIGSIAVISFIIAIFPPEKKADIQIYTDEPNDTIDFGNKFIKPSIDLFIFNAGTAPCFDTWLTTHSFIQGASKIEWKESVKYNVKGMISEETIITAIVDSSLQKTIFYLGIITPGQTIQIRLKPIDLSTDQLDYLLSKKNPSTIKIECVEDSKTKNILLKK